MGVVVAAVVGLSVNVLVSNTAGTLATAFVGEGSRDGGGVDNVGTSLQPINRAVIIVMARQILRIKTIDRMMEPLLSINVCRNKIIPEYYVSI